MALQLQSLLIERIKTGQAGDPQFQNTRSEVGGGLRIDLLIHEDGSLHFGSKLCVPAGEIRQELMREAYSSTYSMHPGGTIIYRDMKQHFWWHGMKREIAKFVAK